MLDYDSLRNKVVSFAEYELASLAEFLASIQNLISDSAKTGT